MVAHQWLTVLSFAVCSSALAADAIVVTAGGTIRFAETGGNAVTLRIAPESDVRADRLVTLRPGETRDVDIADDRVSVEVLRGDARLAVDRGVVRVEGDAAGAAKRRSVAPHRPAPTSIEIIDRAEASGALDSDTALLYRVYALFGSAKLPAQYRGDDRDLTESLYLGEVERRFASLSPATQARVAPYLVPPAYTDSWANLPASGPSAASDDVVRCQAFSDKYAYFDSAKNPLRVWYRADVTEEQIARSVAGEIDDVIAPALLGLMKKTPVSDASAKCNGGDGRLDVYITDLPVNEMGHAGGGCNPNPSYIYLSRLAERETVAHEFFHAIQDAFNLATCSTTDAEYQWWTEASATWASKFVYPGSARPRQYAEAFLNAPEAPLDKSGHRREYGAYLLPYFVQQTTRSSDFVRVAWEGCATRTAIEAFDQAIPGGFAAIWPEFAKANWNHKPVDGYAHWDGLTEGALWHYVQPRISTNTTTYDLAYELPRLSAIYYDIDLHDPMSSLAFFNGATTRLALRDISGGAYGVQYVNDKASSDERKGAHVTALLRIGDHWTEEDWTEREYAVFCRDVLEESIDEVVIVISNSEFEDPQRKLKPPGLAPIVYASNIGCARWQGTIDLTSSAAGQTTTTHAAVQWKRIVDGLPPFMIRYSADGTLDWKVAFTTCNQQGRVSVSAAEAELVTPNFVPPENTQFRSVYLGAGLGPEVSVCSSSFEFPWWNVPLPGAGRPAFRVRQDGKTIDDAYSPVNDRGTIQYNWHLEAKPE